MNLQKILEGARSKGMIGAVVSEVGRSAPRLEQLVSLVTSGRPPYVQDKAAWALTSYADIYPDRLIPHLKKLIHVLRREETGEGIKRSIVRLLQVVDIPKSLEGEVATHCFRYVSDPSEAIAVRCFSIIVLENLAKKNKDLQGELRLILEDQLPYGSAAFVNRGRKVLNRMRGKQ